MLFRSPTSIITDLLKLIFNPEHISKMISNFFIFSRTFTDASNNKIVYSVKSGYNKLKSGERMVNKKASLSRWVDKDIWKIIWKLKVPSKILVFLWRICNSAIPIRWELWKKKVVDSFICSLCGVGVESIEHILLECEWTRGVWFECCYGLRIRK